MTELAILYVDITSRFGDFLTDEETTKEQDYQHELYQRV